MTLLTPQFQRLVSAGAVRLSRELSIAAKSPLQVFVVAFNDKEFCIEGTTTLDQFAALIPEITDACAEVA